MEELVFEPAGAPSYISNRRAVAWRDLREWLSLVEQAGELKRMTEIVEKSDHAIDRSKLLLAIALERFAPDVKIDDEFETDMAELDAAATTVINLAGFVTLGKRKAAPATA